MLAIQNVKLKMSCMNIFHKYPSLINRRSILLLLLLIQLLQIKLVRATNRTHIDLSEDTVLHYFPLYIKIKFKKNCEN